VTLWRNLLGLALGLPLLSAAADPDMMSLIMPDASMVMEINVAKIMASPIGSMMGESFHKGVDAQLKSELAKSKPQFQEQIAAFSKIDWSKEIQDVLIAGSGATGDQGPALVMVRSSLTLARLQGLNGVKGEASEYEGVPIMASSGSGSGVVAFLDNSLLVMGQMNDVRAAIHRRGQPAALPAPMAAQMAKYAGYDIWVATTSLKPPASMSGKAAESPAAAKVAEYAQEIAAFNGGLRFSPDFDLSANVEARTIKAANEMAEAMKWLTSAVQAQTKSAGKGATGLENFKYSLNGRHIALSMHMPEAQLRLRLQQMPAAALAARTPANSAPVTPAPKVPPGMISVQSSEGTVLIPTDKDHQ